MKRAHGKKLTKAQRTRLRADIATGKLTRTQLREKHHVSAATLARHEAALKASVAAAEGAVRKSITDAAAAKLDAEAAAGKGTANTPRALSPDKAKAMMKATRIDGVLVFVIEAHATLSGAMAFVGEQLEIARKEIRS